MDELLICPFCGATPTMWHYSGVKKNTYIVRCPKCLARTGNSKLTEKEARDMWNKRFVRLSYVK